MKLSKLILGAILAVVLTGCASIPVGPSVMVMPGPGKPFDQFQADQAICMQFAQQQIGVNPNEVAQKQVLTGAATGAVLGAATGALVGHGYDRTTASMAGAGLLFGTAAGAGAAGQSTMTLQRRYDIAYQQCMYAKGNQVPGYPMPAYLPLPPPPPVPPPPHYGK
jgi:outer membrane lipoprotein SlyB